MVKKSFSIYRAHRHHTRFTASRTDLSGANGMSAGENTQQILKFTFSVVIQTRGLLFKKVIVSAV
jgi:hypothetical protein